MIETIFAHILLPPTIEFGTTFSGLLGRTRTIEIRFWDNFERPTYDLLKKRSVEEQISLFSNIDISKYLTMSKI